MHVLQIVSHFFPGPGQFVWLLCLFCCCLSSSSSSCILHFPLHFKKKKKKMYLISLFFFRANLRVVVASQMILSLKTKKKKNKKKKLDCHLSIEVHRTGSKGWRTGAPTLRVLPGAAGERGGVLAGNCVPTVHRG